MHNILLGGRLNLGLHCGVVPVPRFFGVGELSPGLVLLDELGLNPRLLGELSLDLA